MTVVLLNFFSIYLRYCYLIGKVTKNVVYEEIFMAFSVFSVGLGSIIGNRQTVIVIRYRGGECSKVSDKVHGSPFFVFGARANKVLRKSVVDEIIAMHYGRLKDLL